MIYILSIGIDCISSILFVVPTVIIFSYVIFRPCDFNRFMAILLFAFYLTAVFSVVGIPAVGTFRVHFSVNFIPLIDIINSPPAYIRNTILNIILFMPLGFLVPVIWENYRSIKTMFFMGLALSAGIEFLQIFSFRLTDIDDLITNTAGTVIGYYISRRFLLTFPLKAADTQKDAICYEPVMILAAMLVIVIFLKPIVSNGIWDCVLSSITHLN